MKFFILLCLGLTSVMAQASDYTYSCKQRLDRSPVDPKVGEISVTVKQVRQIQSYGDYLGEYVDGVDEVHMEIRSVQGRVMTVLKTVNVVAVYEDVMFTIKDKGISFNLYMDEVDETSLSFTLNRKKVKVSLTCE